MKPAAKPSKPAESKSLKGPSGNGTVTSGPKDDERKWKAHDGLSTLQRAEEIKRDPGLMKDIEACRQERMRDLASIKVEVAPKTIKMGR